MTTGLSARTATAAVLLSAAGCGTSADQPAGLTQISPAAANNDIPLPAVIEGKSFRPSYRFDAVSGDADIDVNGFTAWLSQVTSPSSTAVFTDVSLSTVVWDADSMLQAVLPAGIAPGFFDLSVRDPRGQTSRLPFAFESLGPDLTPPVVTIASPPDDGIVGAKAPVAVVVEVDDGTGRVVSLQINVRTDAVSVLPYACSAAAQAKTSCAFSFVAPTPSGGAEPLYIDATAIDGGGNTGAAETVLELVPAPVPTSLSPASGSSLGGDSVTVLGDSFVANATSVLFDGMPGGITAQSPTSLTVLTPAHLAGSVDVTVELGGAPAKVPGGFLYIDPPVVRAISPSGGPAAGGTAVSVVGDNFTPATQILIGPSVLTGATFYNANLIQGVTPPGLGNLAVGAFDPVLGAQTYGMATFDYGADGGLTGAVDGGSVPIPCLPDGGCTGGGS